MSRHQSKRNNDHNTNKNNNKIYCKQFEYGFFTTCAICMIPNTHTHRDTQTHRHGVALCLSESNVYTFDVIIYHVRLSLSNKCHFACVRGTVRLCCIFSCITDYSVICLTFAESWRREKRDNHSQLSTLRHIIYIAY